MPFGLANEVSYLVKVCNICSPVLLCSDAISRIRLVVKRFFAPNGNVHSGDVLGADIALHPHELSRLDTTPIPRICIRPLYGR